MNYLAVPVLMFALVSIVDAGSESFSLGPFNINFWLDTSEKYNVIISENDNLGSVTQYKISVNNFRGEEKAYVVVYKSEAPRIEINPRILAIALENEWNKSYGEANSTLLMIDGYPGFLVAAKSSKNKSEAYGFAYQLDDQTIASGRSTYDWDDGSKSLVDTIHIYTNNRNKAQESNYLPFEKMTLDTLPQSKSIDNQIARLRNNIESST